MIIEDFDFFYQFPFSIQTDIIQNVRTFQEFERSFAHFFEECERGFINEVIVGLYTKIRPPGSVMIQSQSIVKELFFIRSGMVEVFNNENDEKEKDKPVLYLPKYAYFGEY